MNILFIGKRFYTKRDALLERYGRIYQLPYYWQKFGIDVTLWLLDYHGQDVVESASEEGLIIKSTPVRSWIFIRQLCRLMFARGPRPQIIVASGDCYIGLMACLIAKRLKAKFVFDIYDKYDEFPGYRDLLGLDLFRFLRNKADVCFFASRILPDLLGGYRPTDLIVANGVDTKHFRSLGKDECRKLLGIETEAYLVGYFGSMEPDRGIDDLLEAITILRGQDIFIRLIIAGKTDQQMKLERDDVIYLGDIPYQQMPKVLACCDVLALPYRRSAMMDAGASNKIIEYIASGRPIAATRTPNLLANFIEDSDFVNSTAEPGNSKSLAQCIQSVLESPVKLNIPSGSAWPDVASLALAHLQKI